jgi:Uma2 family endonuclease
MLIAEKKKKYTVDDYLLLEEGTPFQLIENELIMSPSPNPVHQLLITRLAYLMMSYLESINDKGFFVVAPMDVYLDDDNAFQPDVLYINADRKAELVKNRINGAPDLVIEILSPSTGYYDLRQKKDIYEKHGVREYVIIDPIKETAELYALTDGLFQLQQKVGNTEFLKSSVISGFSFDLAKLFK